MSLLLPLIITFIIITVLYAKARIKHYDKQLGQYRVYPESFEKEA